MAAALTAGAEAQTKPRVIVLTDIENEPDDAQSMVRFLLYSNQMEVEALIATTSIHLRNRTAPERIRRIVEAYGKVRPNLVQHEEGYPETSELCRASPRAGQPTA
jgi:signal recognition particle receptor subunit beta